MITILNADCVRMNEGMVLQFNIHHSSFNIEEVWD
jgi:hypothetical protein